MTSKCTLVALVILAAGGVLSANPAVFEVQEKPVRCVNTLEDFYGDAGNTFQGALGFVVFQGSVGNPSVSSYGQAIDDMVVEWREFELVEDASDCAAGSCASVELRTTNIFDTVTSTGVSVLDSTPYGSACTDSGLACFGPGDCTAGSCDPALNDCLLDGDYRDVGYCGCSVPLSEGGTFRFPDIVTCATGADCGTCVGGGNDGRCCTTSAECAGGVCGGTSVCVASTLYADDGDCDDDGTADVVAHASSIADVAGERLVANRQSASDLYEAELTITSVFDSPGQLFVANVGVALPAVTLSYIDLDDGTGVACPNDVDPARHGLVQTATTVFLGKTCEVLVVSAEVTTNGDGDTFVDTNETATMRLRLQNNCGFPLNNCVARISTDNPVVECVLDGAIAIPHIDDGEMLLTDDAFIWKASQLSGDPTTDRLWSFDVTMACEEMNGLSRPQSVAGRFDVDILYDPADLTTWTEGFEAVDLSGTKFYAQNNDAGIPGNNDAEGLANGDGWRCQYSDPDWLNSGSYGSHNAPDCYPAVNLVHANAVYWQVDGVDSLHGGRAFSNTHSLYYGIYLESPSVPFTTPLSTVEGAATVDPINLGPNNPQLSWWQQISLMDDRGLGSVPPLRSADRGVVQLQIADESDLPVGDWIRLEPFQNGYDQQAVDNYFNCMFDPVDDGSTEDDFFDPTDPNRRLGPSSTCYPAFTYSCLGDTGRPFNTQNVCNATVPPTAADAPALGVGTWVEARTDLTQFRGKRARLRFIVTSVKADFDNWDQQFEPAPYPIDDGWWIDDIRVDETLVNAATLAVDPNPNDTLPGCGATCNTVETNVLVTADGSPGVINPGSVTIDAPGRVVEFNALAAGMPSFADRCLDGTLQFRFSTLAGLQLRGWSDNPTLVDAPMGDLTYRVEARCSTDPGCADDETVAVTIGCPSTGTLQRFPTIHAAAIDTFVWTTARGYDVFRGPLSQVGVFGGSALPSGTGTQLIDSTPAPAGDGWYYVFKRNDGEFCNELPELWTSGGPVELTGPGSRDQGGLP